MLPSSELFAGRSQDCCICFLDPDDFSWPIGRGTNPLDEVGFELNSRLPGFTCELPKIDEGGGGPAGVKVFVDDGGGASGVVEG